MEKEKIIYLTFDDGPNEPYTSDLLRVLAEHDARATFFLCGRNIQRYPNSVKAIADAGNGVGIHSYYHNFWRALMGMMMAEAKRTCTLIYEATGIDTRLYRSPWGITMPWLARRLSRAGYKIFHWDIMAFDWLCPPAEYIARRVIDRAFPGAIVLLHDGNGVSTGDRSNTVTATKIILEALGKEGYRFKALV